MQRSTASLWGYGAVAGASADLTPTQRGLEAGSGGPGTRHFLGQMTRTAVSSQWGLLGRVDHMDAWQAHLTCHLKGKAPPPGRQQTCDLLGARQASFPLGSPHIWVCSKTSKCLSEKTAQGMSGCHALGRPLTFAVTFSPSFMGWGFHTSSRGSSYWETKAGKYQDLQGRWLRNPILQFSCLHKL